MTTTYTHNATEHCLVTSSTDRLKAQISIKMKQMKWEFTVQVVTYKEQLWDNEYNHVYKHAKTDSFIACTK